MRRPHLAHLAAVPVLLLALSACGSDDADSAATPATDADRADVLTSGSPAPSGPTTTTALPSTSPSTSPSPTSTTRPPSTGTPDGVTYGLITGASEASLTYDKLDYDKRACDALAPKQPVPVATGFKACFSNVNPLTRTVPMSPSAVVLAIREGDPPVGLAADELLPFIQGDSNTAPPQYSSFAITVSGGKVTRIEQFGVSYA